MSKKNKYKRFSQIEKLRRQRSCGNKVGYDTREQAMTRGQTPYKCRNCGKWHRTTPRSIVRKVLSKSADFRP